MIGPYTTTTTTAVVAVTYCLIATHGAYMTESERSLLKKGNTQFRQRGELSVEYAQHPSVSPTRTLKIFLGTSAAQHHTTTSTP